MHPCGGKELEGQLATAATDGFANRLHLAAPTRYSSDPFHEFVDEAAVATLRAEGEEAVDVVLQVVGQLPGLRHPVLAYRIKVILPP